GAKIVRELIDSKQVPDGIISSSDYAALGALQELRKNQILIPEHIKVVGFSNEIFTNFLDIPLSSVSQTPLEMGRCTAQIFLRANSNKDYKPEQIILEPELVIRQSSNGIDFEDENKTAV